MKLLVCGSRKCTQDMLARVSGVLNKFAWHEIIVGDADGIDAEVQEICEANKISYSIYYPALQWKSSSPRKPRNANKSGILIPVLTGSFLKRDEAMVANCDKCVAIWNEESKGTKYTFDYAKKLGKECWLYGKHGLLDYSPSSNLTNAPIE